MNHQETYRLNQNYSEVLESWDKTFYQKYIDTLGVKTKIGRILDVGCGIGYVVHQLKQQGFEAYGVDVSEPSIQKAQQAGLSCQLYQGETLPFANNFFSSTGAINVLEHVEKPELFLAELIRVTQPQGHIIVSSPNFYRVLGLRDYHQQMRGFSQKWQNLKRIIHKYKSMRHTPNLVRFDKMTPITRETFYPDDDAIVATNPWDIHFFLKKLGCEIISFSCTDRYIPKALDTALNFSPLRYFMLNSFTIARKSS